MRVQLRQWPAGSYLDVTLFASALDKGTLTGGVYPLEPGKPATLLAQVPDLHDLRSQLGFDLKVDVVRREPRPAGGHRAGDLGEDEENMHLPKFYLRYDCSTNVG